MRGSRAVNTEPRPPSPAQATQAGWGCTPLPVGGPYARSHLYVKVTCVTCLYTEAPTASTPGSISHTTARRWSSFRKHFLNSVLSGHLLSPGKHLHAFSCFLSFTCLSLICMSVMYHVCMQCLRTGGGSLECTYTCWHQLLGQQP